MITVKIMKKKTKIKIKNPVWEYLKTWVGIFLVGIFRMGIFRGDFPGGSLIDGNFPGGNFPAGSFRDNVYSNFFQVQKVNSNCCNPGVNL